ncbi:MAG: L-serine ammonia-lyase, iron-sulfur-dependent, subunit alpha [Aliidongia sp.]
MLDRRRLRRARGRDGGKAVPANVPFRYNSADALLALGRETKLTIAEITLANEQALRPAAEGRSLPGAHRRHHDAVHRSRPLPPRASCRAGSRSAAARGALLARHEANQQSNVRHAHEIMDRISMFAIAVNEENAAGGRVVTAPTNAPRASCPPCCATTAISARVRMMTACAPFC